MKPLVIYHADCTDGFGAAFAAWLKLGNDAEYYAARYGDKALPDWQGREVYILDFSFPLTPSCGGHRNAAGFEIDIQTLMGWLK